MHAIFCHSDSDITVDITLLAELIRSGSEAQRTVILFDLQNLLNQWPEETVEQLVPAVCERVPDWPILVQITAADALGGVLQQTTTPKRISKLICDAAFQVVTSCNNDRIFEGWGEILVVALSNVEWNGNYEISSVISILDDFAMSEDEVKRKLVARVLGSLSTCLNIAEIESYVLNRALHLADDTDIDVRGMVAESLAIVGAVLDIEIVETIIWPKLLSLLSDTDARIHAATLKTISLILQAHQDECQTSPLFKTLFPPVFISECQFARVAAEKDQRKVDDDTYLLLEIFSTCFGPLLFAAHQYLDDQDGKDHAFQAFMSMSTCNGPIVRRYCAFNLPGVAESLKKGYTPGLSGIAEFLAKDADPETRWNLAAGIHETCRILVGNGSVDRLFHSVISLLQDKNQLVRMNTLEHFQEILVSLSTDNDIANARKLTPVFQNLTLLAEGNWRTQQLLARQLERSTELVPPQSLRANVLPLLCSMAEDSTYLVRKAAMRAIARAIRCLPNSVEREQEMSNFISDWGRGGVYWMRIAFIDCAASALQVCSSSLFESLFAKSLFELAQDSVANVRLRLAGMIHEAAFPCHKNALFGSAIDRLLQDEDEDVRYAIEGVDERIKQKLRDMGSLDHEDEQREKAERQIQERAERLKVESRKKGGRAKVNLFLRKASRPQFGHIGSQNDASPTCVTQTTGFSEASGGANGSWAQAGRSKTAAGSSGTPGMGGSPSPTSPTSPTSPSSPKRNLKKAFGRSGEEGGRPSSPRRHARSLAGRGEEQLPPSPGGRHVLKTLLSNVVSGNRNRT